MNKIEISPSCLIIISKGDAEDYLKQGASSIESASARFYDTTIDSSYSTSLTEKITISDFFYSIKDSFKEPIATLGAANSSNNNNNDTISTNKDSNYTAGNYKITSSSQDSENLGLAVFKNTRIVGELNGIETVCHLILTNKLQSYNLTIQDPFNNSDNLDVYITLRKKPKIKLNLINGSPYINIDVYLNCRLLSMNNESGYLTEENMNIIEETCNYYLKEQLYSYLYKTSKEFEADIDSFGKYAVPNFLTLEDWNTFDWLGNYKNSFFNVNVETNITSGYLLMEM